MQGTNNEKHIKCKLCNKELKSKQAFAYHIMQHSNGSKNQNTDFVQIPKKTRGRPRKVKDSETMDRSLNNLIAHGLRKQSCPQIVNKESVNNINQVNFIQQTNRKDGLSNKKSERKISDNDSSTSMNVIDKDSAPPGGKFHKFEPKIINFFKL